MNNLREERELRDKQIVELLRAGATHAQIKERLRTSDRAISRIVRDHDIPLPPGRIRRSRAELDEAEAKAVTMLWAGASQREVYAKLRVSSNTQARLRKEHSIPVRSARNPTPAVMSPTPSRRRRRETTRDRAP